MPEDFNHCTAPVIINGKWIVEDTSTVDGKLVTVKKEFASELEAKTYIQTRIANATRRKK